MAGGHRSRRRDQYDQYLINHGIDADLLQLGHDECTAVTPTAVTLTAPACTREWRAQSQTATPRVSITETRG
jgi:hypothetical protein